MSAKTDQEPVRVVVTGRHRWSSQHVFNANAFPKRTRQLVGACSTMMAVFSHNLENLTPETENNVRDFIRFLEEQSDDLYAAVTRQPELNFIAEYDSVVHQSYLLNILNSLKSFLDVYAQLLVKLLVPNQSIQGFNKAKVDGQMLAGGRLINFLRRCCPNTRAVRKLEEIVHQNSIEWIDEAVRYRDQSTHQSGIPGMTPARVALVIANPPFHPADIRPPQMPDGTEIVEYSGRLSANLNAFVKATISEAPDVDMSLISFEASDREQHR